MSPFRHGLVVVVLSCLAAACSSNLDHAPPTNEDCQGATCISGVHGGKSGTDAGPGLRDSGTGSVSPTNDCTSDPTTGVTLCATSPTCPAVAIDPVTFLNCGYVPGPVLDVECVCNGTQLCPVGAVSTCSGLATYLSQNTWAAVCLAATSSSGACRDLPLTSGKGKDAGTCDPLCKAQCAGIPNCICPGC